MTLPIIRGEHLFVGDERFTIVGAELHNSSSSTPHAIRKSFTTVRKLGANTVLAPVAWNIVEPLEGQFDFSLVDSAVAIARELGLRLIPLWFGSWKNGMSSYVPAWIKRDVYRFPRAATKASARIEHLTPFDEVNCAADARAFSALMEHLSGINADNTVLMVQVENEPGLLGDSRDRSPAAESVFNSRVPDMVVEAVATATETPVHHSWVQNGSQTEGSWEQLFGQSPATDEAFMAYGYSSYIEKVAAAGRARYDIPLYANAWLDAASSQVFEELPEPELISPDESPEGDRDESADVALTGGAEPGTYPSGGPLPQVMSIWNAAAPGLDFLAPDTYFGFDVAVEQYKKDKLPLFIPEMRRSQDGVGQMFVAIGQYSALGVSPFGVDSLSNSPEDAFEKDILSDGYRMLTAAAHQLKVTPDAQTAGFLLTAERPAAELNFGSYTVKVDTADPFGVHSRTYPAYGLVVALAPDEFLVIGRGFAISFSSTDRGQNVGILAAEELEFDQNWCTIRRLGGDETGNGSAIRIPVLGAQQSTVFPIAATIEHTGIIRATVYKY